jgi:protein-disulfide isomerase
VSRGYNAKRKAKRRQERIVAKPEPRTRRRWLPRRSAPLLPVLVIASILAVVGVLGFGSSKGVSKQQIEQEVTELLSGIPQRGTAIGSPKAPVTLWIYADVQCPTVRLFVENYLPSFIDSWVRTGAVRIAYRSLETDTLDENEFFRQEIAALAAGRQDRMWNFLLTFVRQQGQARTGYATSGFLNDIASQVPGLGLARWHRDRDDALLSRRVALGVQSGHTNNLRYTPSFLIGFSKGEVERSAGRASITKDVVASLGRDITSLREEASEDFPAVRTGIPSAIGG